MLLHRKSLNPMFNITFVRTITAMHVNEQLKYSHSFFIRVSKLKFRNKNNKFISLTIKIYNNCLHLHLHLVLFYKSEKEAQSLGGLNEFFSFSLKTLALNFNFHSCFYLDSVLINLNLSIVKYNFYYYQQRLIFEFGL